MFTNPVVVLPAIQNVPPAILSVDNNLTRCDFFFNKKHPALCINDTLCIRTRQHIRPDIDRLRSRRGIPERDARHTQNTGFLLDPARVSQDEAGI